MAETTTIRISRDTHARVTRLAAERHETIDETVSKAIRALRQDAMARDLAAKLTEDETAWLEVMSRLAAERRFDEFDREHLSEYFRTWPGAIDARFLAAWWSYSPTCSSGSTSPRSGPAPSAGRS